MNSTAYRGVIVVVLITCSMLLLWWFVPKGESHGGWRVIDVTSGDTIVVVNKDGETHTVHLVGIEGLTAECGFEQSRNDLAEALTGEDVVLKPDSRITDPQGSDAEWARYVELSNRDVGLDQIVGGWATVADGEFDRSAEYREAGANAEPAIFCD